MSLINGGFLYKGARALADFLFPPTCISCNNILDSGTNEVMCNVCRVKWENAKTSIKNLFHGQAVVPFEIEDAPYNKDSYIASLINYRPITLDSGFAVGKRLIFELKRHNFKRHIDFLSKELENLVRDTMSDVHNYNGYTVVSIPRNPINYIKTANDGVREIGKSLAAKLNCEYADILVKSIFSKEQKFLSAAQRSKNVSGNIRLRKESARRIKDRRIILIDDVVTTGATVKEAARLLMCEGKAQSVYVYSIAQNADRLIRNL
ncbi:MAG: ComF family protein [Ruminococcaceae bacterium]|nr:ComF family protein [Oscillospiraceae bacterium]